jgi:hypothetical protein
MAVLSREPGVRVSDIEAGYMQFVQWGSLSFVHVDLPSGPIEQPAREAMLRCLRLAVPPILVGDFNVVLHPMDTEDGDFRKHHKFSQALEAIVSELSYVDAFRVLFPCSIAFSWHRRGQLAARLDRVYLPPLLESRPRVARYIATTSDHHAFLLRLELAGVATLPTPDAAAGRSRSLYWKLNTAVLDDPAFRPAFEAAWRPVLASKPTDPVAVVAWWDSTAKPFCVDFCQRFSRVLAAKHLQNRRFFTRALELALASGDWASVGACRRRLRDMDAWVARGAAVRSHIPLVADGWLASTILRLRVATALLLASALSPPPRGPS